VPKSQVAADTKKGAVVKANVSKAPAKPAVTKAAGEPAKKAGMPSELSARTHAAKSVVAKKAPLPASSPAPVAHKATKAAPAKSPVSAGAKAVVKAPAKAASKPSAKPASAAKDTGHRKAAPGTAKAVQSPAKAKASAERTKSAPAKAAPKAAAAHKAPDKAIKAAPKAAKPALSPKSAPPARLGRLGGSAAAPKRPSEGYAKDERFLAAQRAALLRERSTYLEQAASLKAEAESLVEEMEPGDIQFDDESGEGGTVTVDRERDLALSAQALVAVEEIDHTLAKMDTGTYGICENCGRLIPKARLEALPYARLCIDCKSGGLSRR
jgi:DnaK suppressor protein